MGYRFEMIDALDPAREEIGNVSFRAFMTVGHLWWKRDVGELALRWNGAHSTSTNKMKITFEDGEELVTDNGLGTAAAVFLDRVNDDYYSEVRKRARRRYDGRFKPVSSLSRATVVQTSCKQRVD